MVRGAATPPARPRCGPPAEPSPAPAPSPCRGPSLYPSPWPGRRPPPGRRRPCPSQRGCGGPSGGGRQPLRVRNLREGAERVLCVARSHGRGGLRQSREEPRHLPPPIVEGRLLDRHGKERKKPQRLRGAARCEAAPDAREAPPRARQCLETPEIAGGRPSAVPGTRLWWCSSPSLTAVGSSPGRSSNMFLSASSATGPRAPGRRAPPSSSESASGSKLPRPSREPKRFPKGCPRPRAPLAPRPPRRAPLLRPDQQPPPRRPGRRHRRSGRPRGRHQGAVFPAIRPQRPSGPP